MAKSQKLIEYERFKGIEDAIVLLYTNSSVAINNLTRTTCNSVGINDETNIVEITNNVMKRLNKQK